jgi:hypothetical protein
MFDVDRIDVDTEHDFFCVCQMCMERCSRWEESDQTLYLQQTAYAPPATETMSNPIPPTQMEIYDGNSQTNGLVLNDPVAVFKIKEEPLDGQVVMPPIKFEEEQPCAMVDMKWGETFPSISNDANTTDISSDSSCESDTKGTPNGLEQFSCCAPRTPDNLECAPIQEMGWYNDSTGLAPVKVEKGEENLCALYEEEGEFESGYVEKEEGVIPRTTSEEIGAMMIELGKGCHGSHIGTEQPLEIDGVIAAEQLFDNVLHKRERGSVKGYNGIRLRDLTHALNYYVVTGDAKRAVEVTAQILPCMSYRTLFGRLLRLAVENIGFANVQIIPYILGQVQTINAIMEDRHKHPKRYVWKHPCNSLAIRLAVYRTTRAITISPKNRSVFNATTAIVCKSVYSVDNCPDVKQALSEMKSAIEKRDVVGTLHGLSKLGDREKLVQNAMSFFSLLSSTNQLLKTTLDACKEFSSDKGTELLCVMLVAMMAMISADIQYGDSQIFGDGNPDLADIHGLYQSLIVQKNILMPTPVPKIRDTNAKLMVSSGLLDHINTTNNLLHSPTHLPFDDRYEKMVLRYANSQQRKYTNHPTTSTTTRKRLKQQQQQQPQYQT